MSKKHDRNVPNLKNKPPRLASAALAIFLLAPLASCSGTQAPTESSAPAPTAVVMPGANGSPAATGLQTNAESRGPAEQFETVAPTWTPWPEPQTVEYGGQWLDAARDSNPNRYPALRLAGEAIVTTWGALKLPEGWNIEGADGPEPVITDSKGRAVGILYRVESYPDAPWFALMPEAVTPILWETPDYQMDARVITMESDTPSASLDKRKTIIRQVSIITEGPVFDNTGAPSYIATCLFFDKAYVNGDSVEYVISNAMIDEIAKSFVDSWLGN